MAGCFKEKGAKEQNRAKLIVRSEDGERMSYHLIRIHTRVLRRSGPASS